jgi:hypothetical protein
VTWCTPIKRGTRLFLPARDNSLTRAPHRHVHVAELARKIRRFEVGDRGVFRSQAEDRYRLGWRPPMRSLPGSGTATGRVAGFLIGHLDFRQWPRPPTWSTGNKSPSAPIDRAMMTNGCRTAPILPAGRGTGPTPPTQIKYQSRSALAPRRRPGRPATRHRPRGCARRPSTAHTHIREWS